MKEQNVDSQETLEKYQRETEFMKNIKSPNAVKIVESYHDEKNKKFVIILGNCLSTNTF